MKLHTRNMDALLAEESLLEAQRFAIGAGRLKGEEHDEIQQRWIRAAKAVLPKASEPQLSPEKALARLRLMGFEVEEHASG